MYIYIYSSSEIYHDIQEYLTIYLHHLWPKPPKMGMSATWEDLVFGFASIQDSSGDPSPRKSIKIDWLSLLVAQNEPDTVHKSRSATASTALKHRYWGSSSQPGELNKWDMLKPPAARKKKLKALATGKKWVSIAVPALYWGWFGTSWAMKWVKRLYDMGWIKWGVEKLDRLHYWLPKTHILERYKREHHLCSLGLFLNFHGSKKDPSTHTFGSLKMLIILPVLDPVQ